MQRNDKLKKLRSKALFVIVGGAVIVNPAFAQDAKKDSDEAKTLDTVTVAGIRGSLDESMGIKRDAAGVVDAISAEDIGKFPDTNLAESLQRITGVSIERRDGEGAQVTARGFGPQFNMVTLNGRQIPGADAFGAAGQVPIGGLDGGTRAFNFAQLASDAISAIKVFKTGQANVPSGGIGATIDIETDRPLYHDGLVASIGGKLVSDQSQLFGTDTTPELSGIFSWTNPDKTFGVGLSASYQKRHGGSVQATENNWNIRAWDGTDTHFGAGTHIVNAPSAGQLYGMPNDLRYAFADFERERVNAQGVIQFKPADSVTLTLDYTYATNEITENRGEQTIWLANNGGFTDVEFDTNQAVATPIYLRELVSGKDFGFEQQRNMQKYKLGSLGFNANWDVTDSFRLSFDGHKSKTQSLPNDPLTGGGYLYSSIAGKINEGVTAQEMWWNTGLPVMSRTWYASQAAALANSGGVTDADFTAAQVGSQVYRTGAQSQVTEITQGRIDGEFDFDNGRFQFGADSSKTSTHRLQTAEAYHDLGGWGVANVGNEPGLMDLLTPVDIVGLFDDWSTGGVGSSVYRGDAAALAEWAAQRYGFDPGISSQMSADNRVEEKTKSVYLQVDFDGQLGGMATHTRAGVRWEKTDVVSTSVIAIPESIEWQSDNDFRIILSDDLQPFSEKASYSYLLPNLDFSIDFIDSLKGRASFGKTIARAPIGNLYAGPGAQQPFGSVLLSEDKRASGSAQNPALKPLESDNLDLALEWYFADASYVSVTFWDKRVSNFIGNTVSKETLYGLTDPTSGPDAQAALAFLTSAQCAAQVAAAAAGGAEVRADACTANDTSLFAAVAMLRNAGATGGLAAYNGTRAQSDAMELNYQLYGEADDPLYEFNVNRPVNQHEAHIHGWEIGGQYFLGDTGFGVSANYTIVKGNVGINDAGDPAIDQFALTGLSDSANAVFMYEKYGWSVRLAWNWRDEYLILANQGGSRNPFYVEAYDQWDLSVGYSFNDHWSVGFEAINLNGEDVRWHGRSEAQMVKLVDQSPRYLLGVRYKF